MSDRNSLKPTRSDSDDGDNATANNSLSSIFNENFEFPQSFCFICNGYYGPCFEEPICATCHAFVFPDDLSCTHLDMPIFTEKTDDGDSGNDEPTDLFYAPERGDNRQAVPPYFQHNRPPRADTPPQRVDILAERLNLLTIPREPDDVSPGLVECLPPEVLLAVFSYLDDMSLWSAGNVCKRWRHLLATHVSEDTWRVYTNKRWPLFKPLVSVDNWFKIYTQLIESSPCKTCLQNMCNKSQPEGDENSWRRNRLRNELRSLRTDPPEGIQVHPLDNYCCHWQATITGPVGSPFEGGLFYLYLQVPYGYPMCPPIVRFLTKIFHPNVSRHGDVGIDSIQHNWSLALTISKVLISIQSLLTDPFCHVCMEPEIGNLYLRDKAAYEDVARAWTWKYAMHDALL